MATPEVGVGLLCLAFVGVTIVWLHLDQGTPLGNDASRHFEAVFNFHDHMTPLYWFHFENNPRGFYPPLVYLVAVLGTVPAGLSMDGPVIAINVVFVPLYAAGCYGVAREAFGRAAGLPAAIFALAAPAAIGLSHIMLLDLPLAAMVAVTTWALLASNRFENARLALLTGVLVGLGMLTKQLFVVYVAPVAALIIVRGGWRNWRGVTLFCAAAAVVGGPWYIRHLADLRGVAASATAPAAPGLDINPDGTDYARFSLEHYEWYGWAFINAHWYLPLTLVFVGGAIVALRHALRDRRCGYLPELSVGILAGYLGVPLLVGFQDPRYSFPSACFIAALGVGWIAKAKPRARAGATLVLVGLLALNTLAISTHSLGSVELRLPGGEPVSDNGFRLPGGEPLNINGVKGHLVLLADHGYTSGEPERARTLDLLEAAAKDGVTAFSSEEKAETVGKLNDVEIFARTIPIDYVSPGNHLIRSAKGIMLYRRPVHSSDPAPCQRFSDGTGFYVLRGVTDEQLRAPDPRRAPNQYCPL